MRLLACAMLLLLAHWRALRASTLGTHCSVAVAPQLAFPGYAWVGATTYAMLHLRLLGVAPERLTRRDPVEHALLEHVLQAVPAG
eukprot:6356234-Alexandrium_andersonii.AAC.1